MAIAIAFSLSGALALNIQQGVISPTAELPKAALRASSWTTKIPDIEKNLALATEWMAAKAPVNAAGTNETLSMVVGVKDAPLYYDCGLAMNTAWGEMAHNPCGAKTWVSSDSMKDMAPKCSKLRDGEKYMESYRALKMDQDTWCGGFICTPACVEGVQCFRAHIFPFEPKCASYPVKQSFEAKPTESRFGFGGMHSVLWVLLGVAVLVLCIGAAVMARSSTTYTIYRNSAQ